MWGFLIDIFTFIVFCLEISVCKQCCPDQTPRSAASEQGLHCLYMPSKRVSCLKTDNVTDNVIGQAVSINSVFTKFWGQMTSFAKRNFLQGYFHIKDRDRIKPLPLSTSRN